MEKTEKIGAKSRGLKKKEFFGPLFFSTLFLGLIICLTIFVKKTTTPFYLISEVISSVDGVGEILKGRMLVMEKFGFNNSDNYRQVEGVKAELELVRNKLIEIKVKLTDKPWAN